MIWSYSLAIVLVAIAVVLVLLVYMRMMFLSDREFYRHLASEVKLLTDDNRELRTIIEKQRNKPTIYPQERNNVHSQDQNE